MGPRRHHDTVAPRRLGAIERRVRGFQRRLPRYAVLREAGHAEGNGHRLKGLAAVAQLQLLDALPQFLGPLPGDFQGCALLRARVGLGITCFCFWLTATSLTARRAFSLAVSIPTRYSITEW